VVFLSHLTFHCRLVTYVREVLFYSAFVCLSVCLSFNNFLRENYCLDLYKNFTGDESVDKENFKLLGVIRLHEFLERFFNITT